MNINDISLIKNSGKNIVNNIFRENNILLTLEDDVYLGVEYKHAWKCACGDTFRRTFKSIKKYKCITCNICKKKKIEDYQFIKDVTLKKHSNKETVNKLLRGELTIKDDIYLGASHKHTWICKCGNKFDRSFNTIKTYKSLRCPNCVRGIKDKYENIRDVYISKEMSKDEVNSLISNWLTLEDNIYLGNRYKHNWICKCGNVFQRTWSAIKGQNQIQCSNCHNKEYKVAHRMKVEEINDYKYISSYFKGDILPNGTPSKETVLQIKHLYCGNTFHMRSTSFINDKQRCPHCCQRYENSFAYHIEVELGESLYKYWDFNKNTVNPYHIWKSGSEYVWIKCNNEDINKLNNLMKKEYHDSYKIKCNNFFHGYRCSHCHASNENIGSHPFDSFGYKHFDKVMSWHLDNDTSPFRVAPNSNKKFKFICPECSHEWSIRLSDINKNQWCPQCASSKGEKEINSWLRLNNIEFIPQKTYENLLGLGGKNLSYDFHLPDYNLLIEYQGEFHDGTAFQQTEEEFKNQQEHDRRKREYARDNGIDLLEIWYWDFDNIEEILKNKLNI